MVSLTNGFFFRQSDTSSQLFYDDEIRNKEVESLGKRPVACRFASGADLGSPSRGDLLFGSGRG
jgi:hypothetical protein